MVVLGVFVGGGVEGENFASGFVVGFAAGF